MSLISINNDLEEIKAILASGNFSKISMTVFLEQLASSDSLTFVKELVKHNLLDDELKSHLLTEAVVNNNIPLVEYLHPMLPFSTKYIMAAIACKQIDILLWLGIHSSNVCLQDLAFVFLTKYGCLENIKTLLNLGVRIHPQAFAEACGAGHLDIVEFLDNKTRQSGQVTDLAEGLCEAVQFDKHEVVRFIINLGRPFNCVTVAGTAIEHGKLGYVTMMLTLAKEKQPNVTPHELSRPLTIACSKGFHEIVQLLLEAKVPLQPEVYSQVISYNEDTKKVLADKIVQVAILRKDLDMINHFKDYLDHVNLDKALKQAVLIAKSLDMVKALTSRQLPFNLDKAIIHAISVDHFDILTHLIIQRTTETTFDIEAAIRFAALKGCGDEIEGYLYLVKARVTLSHNHTQELECCVCMGSSKIKIHLCDHPICVQCLRQWVVRNMKEGLQVTCPMCRAIL